uniref:Uncharacterized LOC103391507 n=1 Tax=Cynoglossus semilaevis TaxID=244447 RepID=A0A3P8W355_CYNSE
MLVVMTDLSLSVHQETQFISAHVGESISLRCLPVYGVVSWFHWYKVFPGQRPKRILTFYKFTSKLEFFDEFADDPRFSLDTEGITFHLKIGDVNFFDSATYYCANSFVERVQFAEGTTVSVVGSGINIPAVVPQMVSKSIQTKPGGSVNLSCTVHPGSCDGEHSVYWFLSSGEHQPGLLYTSGGRSDQCEKKPNTQTHTCVYNLPLNISNSGTYYCAVASCGHILFGKGTKVESQDEVNLTYLMYAALTFTSILSVFLSVLLVKRNKENCCKCSAPSTTNEEGYGDEENLHYAALSVHNRTRRRMDNVENDCVYSSVRH